MKAQLSDEKLYNELMESAKRVGMIAEQESVEADDNATVSKNVADAIVEGGLNRLIMPKEYGFPQIDFNTFADIVRTVGYHNLSAAWLTYFYALHNSWVAFLPKHRMDEIYDDGGLLADIFAPMGKVEKVEGGFILNGRWNFVSGVNYSEWISVGATYYAEGTEVPDRIGLCMRVSDLEVIENWDSLGLRGSGSNTVAAKDLFVPDDMVISFNEMMMNRKPYKPQIDEDYLYYNVSFFPAFYVGFPAMAIGAAERAIEEFIARTKKRQRFDGTNEGESPKSQRVAAEMTLKLKSAKGLMKEYIEMLESDQGQYDPAEYNGIRVHIIKNCLDIANRAVATLGASALAKGQPLEMILRDLMAISTHVTSLYEDGIDNYGKSLFGVQSMAMG
ncbi:acyl-CoA dehydrogenase family protein [Salinicoccus roseus]|uniref:Acyl-CoA dehydrogenase family protein n=1 Tax=Salinicoccus roseus TaxID=45670 RepID=A0A0C2H903_9STAP|nr:acyl-CoA dehydrogenase family protein [Salinicoccus roseus]KIH70270.1 flavin-dependent monooxygenase [Salinicoccus roseus]MDB0581136.1 acyl-CoA dehydrogenase family protein [Salinicoccus roseus]